MHKRDARRLAAMPPKAAICAVFGDYCQEAVAVAWCESRLQPAAQNGQYLGLFQMGSYERRLFGHGASAREQAVAAHRYFVRSGRDWSPWSCGWAVSLIERIGANCGRILRARVALETLLLVGVPGTCGDSGSATAFGPSMRPPHTRAATATATRTSAS